MAEGADKVLDVLTNNKLLAGIVVFGLAMSFNATSQSAETKAKVDAALRAQESSQTASTKQREDLERMREALVRLEEKQRQDAQAIAEIQKDVKELLRRVH